MYKIEQKIKAEKDTTALIDLELKKRELIKL
jgi:hypothetical protein